MKMNLHDFLNGGYYVGIERRNPLLKVIDSLITEEEADKKIKILNQSDI